MRVVITGAGRGLGRVLASAFDAARAQLGLVARSADALREVADSLTGEALVCPGDIAAHTALGRWGTAEDLAGSYLFLASEASDYVTGTTITVDGGYSLL